MEDVKDTEENVKQKKTNINDILPPFFRNMGDKANFEFDYEINKVKLDEVEHLNTKMYIIDRFNPKEMRIVNYNEYKDKLIDLEPILHPDKKQKKSFSKAFCLKRLVSKKKRRFEDDEFDLDMTYVTKRVIAMGFPSSGCESIYRNSLKDILQLFKKRHNNNVKIYNLCVEKDRIYKKDLFPLSSVTLFPSKDHNPCPIKLILEFCVDLVLHLINNPCSVGAVHCKAGKGRTGVMICSYLVFSGLCQSSDDAFEYYAKVRTYDHKGVTIPSQRRYVKYFESFLQTNFCKPYVHMIPQIIKYHVQEKTKNILKNFMHDERYFVSPNEFYLNSIKIGPMSAKPELSLFICNFVYKPLKIKHKKITDQSTDGKDYFFIFEFEEKVKIDSDIKIKITGSLDYYIWINLWYSTLEIIRQFVDKYHTEKETEERVQQHEQIKKRRSEMIKGSGKQSEVEMKSMSKGKSNDTTADPNNNKKQPYVTPFEDSKINNKKSKINNNNNNEDDNNNDNNEDQFTLSNNNYNSNSNNNNNKVKEVNKNQLDKDKRLENRNNNDLSDYQEDCDKSDRGMIEIDNSKIQAQGSSYVMKKIENMEDEELDVFQIVDSLDHSTNLVKIIKAVNGINSKKKRPLINSEDFTIKLDATELDKFEEVKKMKDEFYMSINYSILQ